MTFYLKEKDVVLYKSVYKILLQGHRYLEIHLFGNLWILGPHLKIFALHKVKLFIRYFPFVSNFAKKSVVTALV